MNTVTCDQCGARIESKHERLTINVRSTTWVDFDSWACIAAYAAQQGEGE